MVLEFEMDSLSISSINRNLAPSLPQPIDLSSSRYWLDPALQARYHSSCRCLTGQVDICAARLKSAPFTVNCAAGTYTLAEYKPDSCPDLETTAIVHVKVPGCILGECATTPPPACPQFKEGLQNAENSVVEPEEKAVLVVVLEENDGSAAKATVTLHMTLYEQTDALAAGPECDGKHVADTRDKKAGEKEEEEMRKYREELEKYVDDHP